MVVTCRFFLCKQACPVPRDPTPSSLIPMARFAVLACLAAGAAADFPHMNDNVAYTVSVRHPCPQGTVSNRQEEGS